MPKTAYNIDGEIFVADSPEEAYQQHAEKHSPGMVSGLAQSFNQGISLGGADELQAAAEAAMGGKYDDTWKRLQSERAAFSRAHPYLSAAATATGAIAPAVMAAIGSAPAGGVGAIPVAARGLQLARNALSGENIVNSANTTGQAILQGARTGVGYGGISGYLGSEDQGAINRSISGLQGGATGAAIGGGIPAVQGAYGAVSRAASPYLNRAMDYFGLNRPNVSPMSTMRTPQGPQDPEMSTAEAKILRALEDAGMTPTAAAARLEEARRLGVPLGLIDVGGQPAQRLARGVRTLPGEGSNIIDTALSTRAKGQRDRTVNFLERALGRRASGDAGTVLDTKLQQARDDSAPFYRQLDSLPPIESEDVAMRFELPAIRRMVQNDERSRGDWGYNVNPLYDEKGSLIRQPTFRDVDLVKRTIDEQSKFPVIPRIQEGDDFATGAMRRRAGERRSEIINDVNQLPGGDVYLAARESYASPAQARDNYEAGLNPSLTDIRAMNIAGTPANRKWFQRGYVESLRKKVDSMPDLTNEPNRTRPLWGNQEQRTQVTEAINPRRREDFADRMRLENETAQTNNFVRSGSQTADKSVDAMDVAADTATAVASGGTTGAVMKLAGKAWDAIRSVANSETRTEIAKHLTNFNPRQQQEFLARLERLQAEGRLRAAEVANQARAIAITSQTE